MTRYRLRKHRRAQRWAVQKQEPQRTTSTNYHVFMTSPDNPYPLSIPVYDHLKAKWHTLYTTRSRRLATLILWALRSFWGK